MKPLLSIIIAGFSILTLAQGNLQFNQVLLIDNNTATVPAGKVWKIENIVYEAVPYFQASSGSGSCSPMDPLNYGLVTRHSPAKCLQPIPSPLMA